MSAVEDTPIYGAVTELLEAQASYEMTRITVETSIEAAAARRETAMREAASLGLPHRKIAEMTGLSHTRVNQIIQPRETAEQARRDEITHELASLSGYGLADLMLALVYSNSLSREEIATATDKTVDEVNSIIREHAERLAQERNIAARKMVERHLPPEMRTNPVG
jgi:DNA-directed RNA polymerase specialized sigma24 family protein